MTVFFAEKFDLAFTAINIFSSRDLDRFSVDKSINNLLSCLLEVVPESFPRYPSVSSLILRLILLYMEMVAKMKCFKLFQGQVNNYRTLSGLSLSL